MKKRVRTLSEVVWVEKTRLRRAAREQRGLGDLEACNVNNANRAQRTVVVCCIPVVYSGKLREAQRPGVEVVVVVDSRPVVAAAVVVVVA